jgi:hypothetical protein
MQKGQMVYAGIRSEDVQMVDHVEANTVEDKIARLIEGVNNYTVQIEIPVNSDQNGVRDKIGMTVNKSINSLICGQNCLVKILEDKFVHVRKVEKYAIRKLYA